MCMICVDLAKHKLTSREARRNLGEMVRDRELSQEESEHVEAVEVRIQFQEALEKASTM